VSAVAISPSTHDPAADLGAYRHPMHRVERPDAVGVARYRFAGRLDRRDLRRRRFVVGEKIGDGVIAEAVKAVKAAQHGDQDCRDQAKYKYSPRPARR